MLNTTTAHNGPNKRHKSELCSGLCCGKHDSPTHKRTRDDNSTSSLRASSWTRGLVAGYRPTSETPWSATPCHKHTHTQTQDSPIELKRCAAHWHTMRNSTNREHNMHHIIVYHCIRAPPLHEEHGHTRPQIHPKVHKDMSAIK